MQIHMEILTVLKEQTKVIKEEIAIGRHTNKKVGRYLYCSQYVCLAVF